MSPKKFTVSDGELVLVLEALTPEDGGGFGVTCPLEPELITEADSLEEAFDMARDALTALWEARAIRMRSQITAAAQ